MSPRIASLALLTLLTACGQQAAQTPTQQAANQPRVNCPTGIAPMARFELFLGGDVGNNEWTEFLDKEVTERFPRGFTSVDARGQWQEMNGQISKEATRILIIVAPNNLVASAYVSAIASAYNERFGQDAAMLVQTDVCMGFVGTALPD
jgi:Protein of unknown function (DUF3574)